MKKALELSISKAFLAEDMGLEEVRIVQTLNFQGGKTPSPFVPGIVPKKGTVSDSPLFEEHDITFGRSICQ